ncbi:MAG TPA: TldD/PmbA family protein [Candidatus Limnocylindria bacterium]|jgi:PmbA protein|nr:TldD/PmbA family protein [Candidatus Limnocylindria bacterium]
MTARLENDEVVDRALQALRSARVATAEVLVRDALSGSVETKDGELENVVARGERGLGVRVLDGQRMGFAHTSDLTPSGIEACVGQARRMATITEPDDDLRIASAALDTVDLDIYQAGLEERPLADRGAVALAVERAARGVDRRITHFRKTSYSDAEITTVIATTTGVRASYRESHCGAMTSAVATQNGERQIGYHGEGARRLSELAPERIGARAAERALEKLGAKPFPTAKLPVVLDPWMAMSLLGAIAPLFSADNVLKGRSLFAGKVGERVANERVTIVDDARRRGGLRSSPFDGEGVATTTRTLVERGVLRGYLTNLKTARKLTTAPTGNARRGSYASPSRIGPSNFYIEAGRDDADAAVRGLDRALAITSLLNLHTIDPVSGEFSLGATGTYLEKGAPVHPVQGITIAGNLTHLLASISNVGTDLTFGASGIGSPTLVIAELSIGGT